MEIDIFDRVRKRLATGKDFDPQMVIDLCRAYDEQIARLKSAQQSVRRTAIGAKPCPNCGSTKSSFDGPECPVCGR